ncbi:hypothetical protein LPJ71_003626 [Coemansia sp. S17]|nr:hypothetical protein LPJ71_003626 [Coemansia sp. S17]
MVYPKKWFDVSKELKQSCLDFLKAQGYDVPDEYRLVFQLSGPKRYLLYGKGVPIRDADDCFDDDTEFLMLRMKNGIMRMVTKKKTLLRYRVYLLDREVRTKNSKPRVLRCETCDHPRECSREPCVEGCPCCLSEERPVQPTEPAPESAQNE